MSAGPTEVFGPYLVYEQLGAGGMARVDRAELTGIEGFHRQIALKRMLPHVAANEDMIQAFVREARLASHLRHGNVAQTYELGKVDGIYFIAMELITGPTLRAVLKHCAHTTGPMPVPVALNILNQICDALDYAHNLCDETGQRLGIIHRDVSPSNIIIDEAGVAKLIDFGIAKVSAAGMQTMSGTLKGKFGYMAPEYILGQIDARADLFAIGVIAHELLTNRPLFSVADDMETLRRVRTMPLQPPSRHNPHVPPEIDDVVMTALSRDPDRRWQHATALRTAMTTLTHRLGLVCTNQQMIEWITWALDHTKPRGTRAAPGDELSSMTDPSEPSVVIEAIGEPPTQSELPTPQRLAAALGTPAGSITAPAITAPAPASLDPRRPPGEERGADAAYGHYAGLGSGPRNTDEIVTALLRPTAPREVPEAQPSPRTTGPARTRGLTEPAPQPSGPAIRDATLLDGAAALRGRAAAQPAAAPLGGPGRGGGGTGPAPALPHGGGALRPSGPLGSSPPVSAPSGAPSGPLGSSPPASAPGGLLGSSPPRPLGSGAPALPALTLPSSAPPPPARAPAPVAPAAPEPRSSALWVVVLVLLAAGLAALGVYLVLPHLT